VCAQEALESSTMAGQPEVYFLLLDGNGKPAARALLPFANIEIPRPGADQISGNEKVVRPRLTDAKFFFLQDRKPRWKARNRACPTWCFPGSSGLRC